MTSMTVTAASLADVCKRALVRFGASTDDAATQAAQLVEAELRGYPSHGLLRLTTLCARLDAGLIVSGVAPELTWIAASSLRVDGRNGFGTVIAQRVLDDLIPRAQEAGVAVAAIRRSHHLGILAPYVQRIADAECVGIVLTTSEALVHPWGGARALVGTNPIGIGLPSRDGAVILDMSTGAVSAGKILSPAARDEPIREGWAVDVDGRPTTDARAA